jgi:hypothetical protein
MINKMKVSFAKLVYGLLLTVSTSLIYAQDFEVAPVILNFKADPGSIETQKITIRNHAGKKQNFEFKTADYSIDESGNKKRLPAGTSKRSCADWLSISPSLLELNPNESREVIVTMTVPKDGFSTRWGLIYVQTAKEQTGSKADKSLNTGVVISPRIVIQVTQSPNSNSNYKAVIQNLQEITKPGEIQRSFKVDVSNVGDKPINANVFLTIADVKTAKEIKYKPEKINVFPDGVRNVVLKLPADVPKGKYALAALLDYGHGTALEGVQMMIEIK